MNTLYRCALAATVAFAVVAPGAAQMLRRFPHDALRGAIVFGDGRQITLNGNATSLTPGSRVRDQNNRIVFPAALTGGRFRVNYLLGLGEAQVGDVWILTADEAAVSPWPRTLEEAQTWRYDAGSMTWTKP